MQFDVLDQRMMNSTADYRLMVYAASTTKPDRDSNDWHTPARYIEAARIVLVEGV